MTKKEIKRPPDLDFDNVGLGDDKVLITLAFYHKKKLWDIAYLFPKEFIKTEEKTLIDFYKKALSKVK